MGLLLLAGMVILSVVNLAQFSMVEARGSVFFSALHQRESADILSEMWDEDASSSSRYAPFLALGFISPGSVVLVAEEDSGDEEWFPERLYAFGRVKDVKTVEGSALDRLGNIDPSLYVVASGPGGPRGEPWAIAVEGGDSWTGSPTFFLQDAFASPHPIEGESRTFLIVRWPMEPDEGHRWLLVDVDLLSEEGG